MVVLFTGASVEEAIQNGLREVRYSTDESTYQSDFS